MSHQPILNKRYQNILKAIIQHYIATAEPVGSKTIATEYDFNISSATIRNIMGRLEKEGLIYQPYTSAGRIPSDWGYRTYVDRLITLDEKFGQKIEKQLNKHLDWEKWNFEVLVARSTGVLAALSGYIALITLPQNKNNILRHLQLVPISSEQVMLIIVTDSYQTQSVLMESSLFVLDDRESNEEIIEQQLQVLSNFLNSKLKGRSLRELASFDWVELDREFECYADFLKALTRELKRFSQPSPSTPIMIRGISELLRQPEFSQLQQVQTLLHLLEEEQEQLWSVIFAVPDVKVSSRLQIRIGSENLLEPMRSCTLISANYCQDDVPVGSVGIIGPTRMLYENAIALVETTADYLSEALS